MRSRRAQRAREPGPRGVAVGRELTLDFDALERAAQDARRRLALPLVRSCRRRRRISSPPRSLARAARIAPSRPTHVTTRAKRRPPVARIRARSPSREVRAAQSAARREESPQPARAATRSSPSGRPPGDARYAPARPAAIFGNTQRPQPQSLFSDELVSDKSLDEVILSYLAEDLEPPRRK